MKNHQDPNCIFCKIINKEIPCYKVYENENFLSFITIKPYAKGHILIIPKIHSEDILEANSDTQKQLFELGVDLAKKIKDILKPKRVTFMLAGLGVAHTHLHLIPINSEEQLNPETAYDISKEEIQEVLEFYKNLN